MRRPVSFSKTFECIVAFAPDLARFFVMPVVRGELAQPVKIAFTISS